MNFWLYTAAFVTGILASMGLGGGMVLILYLTLAAGISQITAQGINLLFFIPIAALALVIHSKNKLVKWKKIVPSIICGVISAIVGAFLAKIIGNQFLTKLFAVFVLIVGLKELFPSFFQKRSKKL